MFSQTKVVIKCCFKLTYYTLLQVSNAEKFSKVGHRIHNSDLSESCGNTGEGTSGSNLVVSM